VHERWWTQPYIYDNAKTKEWLISRRWEMKGWYDAKEQLEAAKAQKNDAQKSKTEEGPLRYDE
jgi:hypothetical protein